MRTVACDDEKERIERRKKERQLTSEEYEADHVHPVFLEERLLGDWDDGFALRGEWRGCREKRSFG